MTRGGGRIENALRGDGTLLYVVRHGNTELNDSNKFRGFMDVPLDDRGRKAASDAAGKLSDIPYRRIYSSDMSRSIETANALNSDGHADYKPIQNLRPLNVGDFAGMEKSRENRDAIEHYVAHPAKQIPGGESLNQFKLRVRPEINHIIDIARADGVPSVLVAHSSTIHELGDMFHGDHTYAKVKPGGIVKVSADGNGKPKISVVDGADEGEKDRIS